MNEIHVMHAIVEIRNLSDRERKVVEAFLRHADPVSQRALMSSMSSPPSQATMSRTMNSLISRGLLMKHGETRGARFSLTKDARRVATNPRLRNPIPYDPDRIASYAPNKTSWLPEKSSERMRRAIEQAGGQRLDASTFRKAIAERFLIDLSWASSNLEGNTYDHLSTELLIKYGSGSSGRDRLETAMILNHKAAISTMLDGLDEGFPDPTSAQRRHVLMMRDLLDPADLGAVRKTEVSISATSYRPSSDRIILSIGLTELFVKAAQVDDPLEASFFLLAGMSYLQAFADGNKRMGRLFSSEPLLRAALPPLSFVGIDKTPYILGLIEFYETGNTELLGKAIAESYEITAPQYIQSIHTQRVPRALELRERVRVDDALGAIFRGLLRDDEISELVDQVFQDLSQEDRSKVVEILVEKADRSSPETAFLYGVDPNQIEARNLVNRHPSLCLKCRVDPCECNDGPEKP